MFTHADLDNLVYVDLGNASFYSPVTHVLILVTTITGLPLNLPLFHVLTLY